MNVAILRAALAFALSVPITAQTICYVDDDAPPGGNGQSWGTAVRYLQDAVAAFPSGTEFHIAGGIQRPDLGAGITPLNLLASIKPKDACVFKGGYRGLSPGGNPDDRDLTAFPTTITADLAGNDPTSYADNSYHLFEVLSTVNSVAFDGMRWHGGRGIGNGTSATGQGGALRQLAGTLALSHVDTDDCRSTYGGGVAFYGTSAMLEDCRFVNCIGQGGGGQGGALRLSGNSATVEGCTFSHCAGEGSGIYSFGASLTVRDSTFDNGFAYGDGASINSNNFSVLLVEACEFESNIATGNGGAIFARESSVTFRNSTFRSNTSSGSGGGLMCWFGSLSVEDCSFESNSANSIGGGLSANQPSPCALIGSRFTSNHTASSGGGAGVIAPSYSVSTWIHDCVFENNISSQGQGLMVNYSGVISRCWFADNSSSTGAELAIVAGPGMNLVLDHCTLWSHAPWEITYDGLGSSVDMRNCAIWNPIAGANQVLVYVGAGTLTAEYCNIKNLPAAWSGSGNFNLDPLFVAPQNHDFHLGGNSPCIDTGDPAAPSDLDGTRSDVGAIPFDHGPTAYCTTSTSTNGCAPSIGSSGLPHAGAPSGFVLQCSGLDGQRYGVFFYGLAAESSPWGIGSASTKCVASPWQPMTLEASNGATGLCDGAFAEDWSSFCVGHPTALGSPFATGSTFFAQCWFRDPLATTTTNLTDALSFTVRP